MSHILVYFKELAIIIYSSNEKNNKFTENDRFYWK